MRLLLLSLALSFLVELLVSDATPFSCSALIALLPSFHSQAVFLTVRTVTQRYCKEVASPDVILDYTYSQTISARILEENYESLIISMYRDAPLQEIRTYPKPEEYAKQIADYLLALNFTKGFLVSESSSFYATVTQYLQEHPLLLLTDRAVLDPYPAEAQIERIVGRLIKPSGNRIGVFLVGKQSAGEIIK